MPRKVLETRLCNTETRDKLKKPYFFCINTVILKQAQEGFTRDLWMLGFGNAAIVPKESKQFEPEQLEPKAIRQHDGMKSRGT